MSFIKYFHNDTDRTFPPSTDFHAQKILHGLNCPELKEDEEEVGIILQNFKDIIISGVTADCIKSSTFYKKDKDYQAELDEFLREMPDSGEFSVGPKSVMFTHGVLGITSENAELTKALVLGLMNNEKFDVYNVKEEIGDILVYAALIGNALGFTLEDAMKINIAKRAKRFPNGFNEYDATHRDLESERKILEGNH